MKTINLIGCGRVGQTLARLWQMNRSFEVQDIMTTSLASAQRACDFIGAGRAVDNLHAMRAADVWMLATPDAQLVHAAAQLAQHGAGPAMAFHCSGALAAAHLAPLAQKGWPLASAHCILSFASAPTAVEQFAGTLCALEGDAAVCSLLRSAFTDIGAHCFDVASQDKLLYHAAAVFATNFLPVLQSVAEDLWQGTGVPAEYIPALRASLLHNAVANITRLGPQAALTGPAARGDRAAIARQAQAVTHWDSQAGAAYEALSALALRLAQRAK